MSHSLFEHLRGLLSYDIWVLKMDSVFRYHDEIKAVNES